MAKEKFQIEFIMHSNSLNVLWNTISTPSGLSEWFAEDVSVDGKNFTFRWGKNEQTAELVFLRVAHFVRFRWTEDISEKTYFEFKINVDALTGDVALVITDFAEPDEKVDAISLWTKQVDDLKRNTGM